MKLKSVRITNFKSIGDSSQFDIADVTCLVGKNESGKTALLQSLYRLNPVVPEHGNFNVTEDYPRSDVEEYRQQIESGESGHETVVQAEFELDDSEAGQIEDDFGEGVLKTRIVRLSKSYENKLCVGLDVAVHGSRYWRHWRAAVIPVA